MYCTKCGAELPDDSRFCYRCGAAVKPIAHNDTIDDKYFGAPELAPNPIATGTELPNQSSTADEGVYGLLGFVLSFFLPIVGLILSIMGVNKKKNSGFAAAGIIISIIYLVLAFVVILLTIEGEFDFFSRWW